jgi:hypothetical protein
MYIDNCSEVIINMAIFLLLSIPVFFLFATFYVNQASRRFVLDYISFFKGMIWFFPILIVLSFIQNIFKVSYKPVEHYLFYFYRDHFLYALAAVGGFFAFFRMSGSSRFKDPFLTPLAFFSGFYTLVSINNFLVYIGEFDLYILILLPMVRIASIVVLSLLIQRFIDEVSTMKIVYGIAMAGIPIVCSFVSFTFKVNLDIQAFILALSIAAGSCTLYYFWERY